MHRFEEKSMYTHLNKWMSKEFHVIESHLCSHDCAHSHVIARGRRDSCNRDSFFQDWMAARHPPQIHTGLCFFPLVSPTSFSLSYKFCLFIFPSFLHIIMSSSEPKEKPDDVSCILASAHERLRRIDDLERRINDRAIRARRRITNLLEHAPTHRQSHLRCFVTHQYKVIPPTETSPLPASEWKIRIEGKLLIGHLDHESAEAYDCKTNYKAPTDDLDRSKGEKEEEEVLPIKFTHFFDKVEAQFQPIYSPKPNPMAAAMLKKKSQSSSKKRRSGGGKASVATDDEDFRRSLVVNPFTEGMAWKKSMSEDAHAFDLVYRAPPPHESRYQIHCVIAKVQLYPSTKEPLYKVVPALLAKIFPNHPSNDPPKAAPNAANSSNKKRPTPDEPPLPDIPTDPEIDIPEAWTMSELSMAFYHYIQENQLVDETNPSIVVCNETLQSLFHLERFSFAQLQSLLVQHDLIRQNPKHGVEPVRLTYICKVANSIDPPPPDGFSTNDDEDRIPALLQLDMDILVPSLFPFRCREILRRIKRRELEYTSSRTKGRYILMARKAKDEEDVKTKIEDVVAKEHLGRDVIAAQTALAKAAPPRTEARMVSHTDARLSLLMEKVEEECTEAQQKWHEYQQIVSILEKASRAKDSPTEPMDTS